jgi:glycine/D-amino acid oxidase-like deaminating enzyme
MKVVDYIIVGQGLAASVLASKLIEANKKVLVIDEGKSATASRIAAGLCNPIVFKRLTKSWIIDSILDKAKAFYSHQEKLLGEKFFFDLPIYKLFTSEEEQLFWKQKSNESELFDWLNPEIEHPFDELVYSEFGAAHVLKSGFLYTEKWLDAFKEYIFSKGYYENCSFNHSDIKLINDQVRWQDYEADKIIFCEGYQCTKNPYFDWLPFKLTKGETLTLNFDKLDINVAINKGAFMLPYNGKYKVGATYDWENLNENPTEEGKLQLLKKVSKLVKDNATVLEHHAGVRPTVKDRRPLIGIHPKFNQLVVFNGMGTKGVMYAPHMADKLVDLILNNEPIPEEIDINRFWEKEA